MSSELDGERSVEDRIPPGERILWQGEPRTWPLARRAYHAGLVTIYFAVLVAWSVGARWTDGEPVRDIAVAASVIAAVWAAAMSLLLLLAWLQKRSTAYMITSERVVMRFGVALPITLNVPFRHVAAADMKLFADGTGDISLRLTGERFIGFVPLWPHVRAWRLARPEPTLRAVPEAASVSDVLKTAILSASDRAAASTLRTEIPAIAAATPQRAPEQRIGRRGAGARIEASSPAAA